MRTSIMTATIVTLGLSAMSLAGAQVDRYGTPLPEGAIQRLGTLIMRYPDGIGDLCYLPDGRGLIAIGARVEVWDLASGTLERTDEPISQSIRSIEPNREGTTLLIADSAGSIHLWDMDAREIVRSIATEQPGLMVAHYSPDETRALTTGTLTLKEWDLATGEELVSIEGRMHYFRQGIYAADGLTAFVDGGAGSDPILAHYDLQSGELLQEWHKQYYSHSRSLELSPDGERLLSGTRIDAREWDVESYEMLAKFTGHHGGAVTAVAYCANPDELLTGSRDGSIRRWNRHTAEVLLRWWPHEGHVTRIRVSPDGQWALSYGGGLVDERSIEDGTPRIAWERHSGIVPAVAAIPGGSLVVSGSSDETLRVWDTDTGESLRTIAGVTLGAWALAVSPDGERVAAGGKDAVIREFSLADGALLRELRGHRGYIRALAYTPGGTHLLSSADDGRLCAWGAGPEPVHELHEHRGGVLALDVSADGNHALSAGRDGTVRYWSLSGRRLLRTMTGHRRWVQAVRFLDEETAVSADGHGATIVWDLATGEALRTMQHTGAVTALVADDDLICAGGGSEISCWDAATGEKLETRSGHADAILALTTVEDGRLVSASEDTTLLVWEPILSTDTP